MPRTGRRNFRSTPRFALFCSILLASSAAHGADGRLIIRLEGDLAGPIPPTLIVSGPGREESKVLDALALASRRIAFERLEPGIYRIALSGEGAVDAAAGVAVEIGIHDGLTTVVNARIDAGRIAVDPFRPDPFGLADGFDAQFLSSLPGSGDEGGFGLATSPEPARRTTIDGLDLIGGGFRHTMRVSGGSMVRAVHDPIGPAPASEERGARKILSRFGSSYGEVGGATGSGGRRVFEGILSRSLPKLAWRPDFLVDVRRPDYTDAAPSVFTDGDLPHNDLEGLEIFGRVDARPAESTRLRGAVYGQGTQRHYFMKSFEENIGHAPREDRASIEGGLQAIHQLGERSQILAGLDVRRDYTATGDGRYFDNIAGYASAIPDPEGSLYWPGDDPDTGGDEGHRYNYFRKQIETDWVGSLEVWRDASTSRSAGAGLLFRRGTYRSYENLSPVSDSPFEENAIGYGALGESHSEESGREAGHPLTLAGFATARRPILGGGEIEAGLRSTFFRSGQDPIRSLPDQFETDGGLDPGDLGEDGTHTAIDPRIAITWPVGSVARVWLSGGGETRIPPSEAIYYSPRYLEVQVPDPARPVQTILGNPSLKPERAWLGAAAIGARLHPEFTLRAGVQGTRVNDAITPRVYRVGGDSLAFYVNDGVRDRIGLFVRGEWEPSSGFVARISYDLGRARTQTVEPELLDAGWDARDLPARSLSQREGFLPVIPALWDGEGKGYFPSARDRRHRISAAVVAHPPADVIGEAGEVIFKDFEFAAVVRAASGAPFTWTQVYAAGLLAPGDPPAEAIGFERNDGRLPWTGQLDLRVARSISFTQFEVQIWVDVTNVTDRKNVIRAYQATGEGADDGWLNSGAGRREVEEREAGFAAAYADRIRDPLNYGEPRMMQAGLRLRFP